MNKEIETQRVVRKKEIIPYFAMGMYQHEVARKVEVSLPTIARWVKELRDAGFEVPTVREGRPSPKV